jgi:hypothetical protein
MRPEQELLQKFKTCEERGDGRKKENIINSGEE